MPAAIRGSRRVKLDTFFLRRRLCMAWDLTSVLDMPLGDPRNMSLLVIRAKIFSLPLYGMRDQIK